MLYTFGQLEFADEEQLAFILAHEIGHLVKRHPEQMEEHKMRLFGEWYDQNANRISRLSAQAVAEAFLREKAPELEKKQVPWEAEADAEGRALMQLAGYKTEEAARALERAQDWLWAQGDTTQDKTHDPLSVRVERLRKLDRALGQTD